MKFLEKDLEEIIFNTNPLELYNRGFLPNNSYLKKYKQLKVGNYGVLDMLYVEKDYDLICDFQCPKLIFTICEFKKDKIGISTLLQAIRYAKGIQRYLRLRGFNFRIDFRVCLVGYRVDTSDFIYMTDLIPNCFLMCYTYKYEIDGLKFNREYDYRLIEEGFGYED